MKISDTHQQEFTCLKDTVCYPESPGWCRGLQPGLDVALTWISTPGTCLWAGKNAPSIWLLSSSCRCRCAPCTGVRAGLLVRGKALPLAALAQVLAALGSLCDQGQYTLGLQEVWMGCGGEGAPCGSGGPGAEAGECARPVKQVKRALYPFKLSLKLYMV